MAALPARKIPQRYSWCDYQRWPANERWELIDGLAYDMSPAPTTGHQSVVGALFSALRQHLKGKRCRPFVAPTDVKLSDFDVVQPDILVVCDLRKITPTHIEGAPDLVIEVLSPSTASKDLREKRALYEQAGVREYLVVDPFEHYAQIFRLDATGRFAAPLILAAREEVSFVTLPEVSIPLEEIFDLPEPLEPWSPTAVSRQ